MGRANWAASLDADRAQLQGVIQQQRRALAAREAEVGQLQREVEGQLAQQQQMHMPRGGGRQRQRAGAAVESGVAEVSEERDEGPGGEMRRQGKRRRWRKGKG